MSHRIERLNSELQKAVTGIIRQKIKDPRVNEMVSVLEVSAAKDLKTAKVRVSIFGENSAAVFEALSGTAGFIRKELADEFKNLRTIPQLTFVLDTSAEHSRRINELLDQIKND